MLIHYDRCIIYDPKVSLLTLIYLRALTDIFYSHLHKNIREITILTINSHCKYFWNH